MLIDPPEKLIALKFSSFADKVLVRFQSESEVWSSYIEKLMPEIKKDLHTAVIKLDESQKSQLIRQVEVTFHCSSECAIEYFIVRGMKSIDNQHTDD